MLHVARARTGVAQGAALLVDEGDQVIHVLDGGVRGHIDAVQHGVGVADGLHVLQRVAGLAQQGSHTQRSADAETDGVAVGVGVGHLGGADGGGAAGHVDHLDGHANDLGHLIHYNTGKQVGAAAGGEGNDDLDAALGVIAAGGGGLGPGGLAGLRRSGLSAAGGAASGHGHCQDHCK